MMGPVRQCIRKETLFWKRKNSLKQCPISKQEENA